MANIEIDGKALTVPDGSTVIDAADAAGIYIPRFCYHKKLSVAANCRMCLVEVEKAPKPVPACATPVVEGMKVQTRSVKALAAQKAVMEFMLINHPLDCPICDQGGECQLQDLAVGYGKGESRYHEEKRVVFNKNLGPLISTDMTRCIHCTRCVRFGQEIGGMMEMGQIGRGEHSEITPFLGHAIESELSGNMIDLCPVGALTSLPFRYKARSWELRGASSISPHDGLGSNIEVQSKNGAVVRVLPRDNEAINDCWLSDRERFAYEGLNSTDRLTRPMIKQNDQWRECDWQYALDFAATALKAVRDKSGANEIGALGTAHATAEELFLLQKLTRALGSDNVDFRLRQADFSLATQGAPWLGMPIAEVSGLSGVLLIGTTLRADHPLLALRLRQAVRGGASVGLVNPVDDDLLMPLAKSIVAPAAMVDALEQVRRALSGETADANVQAIAAALKNGEKKAVLLGNLAQHHPQSAKLIGVAQQIAELAGAKLGFLGEAANSVGGYLVQALPQLGGRDAGQMLSAAPKAMILLGVEAERDTYAPAQAMAALQGADLVVALATHRSDALLAVADVLLPVAPFSETSGTYVNCEGRVQSFAAAVKPQGEARPAWKVLRVLGNLLGVAGFDYESSEQVRADALGDGNVQGKLNNAAKAGGASGAAIASGALQRIGEVAAYHADALVRRAPALQKTSAAQTRAAMNGALLARLGINPGESAKVSQGGGSVIVPVVRDDKLPDNCVRLPAGCAATAALGGLFDEIKVEKA